MKNNTFWMVVPAAGVGKRMGASIPKQYLSINGATIIEHTLNRLVALSQIESIIVAISDEDQVWDGLAVSTHPKVQRCSGGKERSDSVLNALNSIQDKAKPNDWVLVHDVVRPCVRLSDVTSLIDTLKEDAVGGILASPVVYTVKQSNDGDRVNNTVDRESLFLAQTPQMFRYQVLRDALIDASENQIPITDEASAVERLGKDVRLVAGEQDNIKITQSSDLALAEFYLSQQLNSA